jgi:hypothetical protein
VDDAGFVPCGISIDERKEKEKKCKTAAAAASTVEVLLPTNQEEKKAWWWGMEYRDGKKHDDMNVFCFSCSNEKKS